MLMVRKLQCNYSSQFLPLPILAPLLLAVRAKERSNTQQQLHKGTINAHCTKSRGFCHFLINSSSEAIVCTNPNFFLRCYLTIPHTYTKFRAILKRSRFNFRIDYISNQDCDLLEHSNCIDRTPVKILRSKLLFTANYCCYLAVTVPLAIKSICHKVYLL